MSQDLLSQFYTCLNYPLPEKISELTRIIELSSPNTNKDLQSLFPQLIGNIFVASFNNTWGLRVLTYDANRYEFELLMKFFEPRGPMFQLCYKLMTDPQLKYNLPLNQLPLDLQVTLQRGQCSQFYTDMLTMDPNSQNVIALGLNPFDYYIFNFALYLINNYQNKTTWENWNSVYFSLACDYLMHFLPTDPNVPVLPHIPNYTGKVPLVTPLQTSNRPLYSPSLLILPDAPGLNSQHNSSQSQSRNEVWRSETVLQVFIDLWMSVEEFSPRNIEMFQRNYQTISSSPERVRTTRVLVKHIHSFYADHLSDPTSRTLALRKYARQFMCKKAYHYVKHLVTTWPLDASFRLVMELWLSLIQPWRYRGNTINQDRYPSSRQTQEDMTLLDGSYVQYICENLASYCCILRLVLPRFLRLDLTAYKNAIMLFRLGKVFSQQHLVIILKDLEQALVDNNNSGIYHSPDSSYNHSGLEQSFTSNVFSIHKWIALAKQSVSEMNMSTSFEYDPIWSENKKAFNTEFIKKILNSKVAADKLLDSMSKINQNNKGFWSSIKHWLMIDGTLEEEQSLEECKKVPVYLNSSLHFFSQIFGINETLLTPLDSVVEDSILDQSSFGNNSQFPYSITNKLREKHSNINYMGDPDLMPITSYESTILVRMFYQIATRINETYSEEFSRLWNRNDLLGYIAREVLQSPCAVQTYVKDGLNHQNLVRQDLPPRLSLRLLGSKAFAFWVILGYLFFKLFMYNGYFYTFLLAMLWIIIIFVKASMKMLK